MRRLVAFAVLQVVTVGAIAASAPTVLAAAARGKTATSTMPTGNDVSYPQCGSTYPASPAFAIVGMNEGLANDLNPCFGPSPSYPSYRQSELYWAAADSTGGTSQSLAALYVNTADPGNVYGGTPIADWPTSGTTPDGTCTTTSVTTSSGTHIVGANSPACAWQYGYNRATQDVAWVSSAAAAINKQSPPVTISGTAGSYVWWLDVETTNSWQTGTSGQAMNVADLQGMIAALQQAGATSVGAYSTGSQWTSVTGGTTSSSGSLYGMPDWIPGAKTQSRAISNCGLPSFTGGQVAVTQWRGRTDNDYAC